MNYRLTISEEDLQRLDPVSAARVRELALAQAEEANRHGVQQVQEFKTTPLKRGEDERRLAEKQRSKVSSGIHLPPLQQ